ncbi:MAG: PKD domain-containing protein, partial [Pirellulaceae bacterium]|nr:PKD domain-containing protein [Pirellulaceae bacterium]
MAMCTKRSLRGPARRRNTAERTRQQQRHWRRRQTLLEHLEVRAAPGSALVDLAVLAAQSPDCPPQQPVTAAVAQEHPADAVEGNQLPRVRSADDSPGAATLPDDEGTRRQRVGARGVREYQSEHPTAKIDPERRGETERATRVGTASRHSWTSTIDVGLDGELRDELREFLAGVMTPGVEHVSASLDHREGIAAPSARDGSGQAPDLPSAPEPASGVGAVPGREATRPRAHHVDSATASFPALPRRYALDAPPATTESRALPASGALDLRSPLAAATPAALLPADRWPTQVARLGFDQGLDGWAIHQQGGSAQGRGSVTAGSAVLHEGDSFLVTLEQNFQVPEHPVTLVFTYEAAFDTTAAGFIRDAFEAVLLDAEGYSLVSTFHAQRSAFFNLTEEMPAALAAGTSQQAAAQGQQVTLDLSGVPAGTQTRLLFRLINNDSDTDTTIRIHTVEVFGESSPPQLTAGLLHDTAPEGLLGEPYRTDRLTNDPTVIGTATDDRGVVRLEAQVNDGPQIDITHALSGGVYTFDPGPLSPGAHRITIRATDEEQNTSSAVVEFRVNAPPISDAGGPRTIDEGSTLALSGAAASDVDGPLFGYLWNFHDGMTSTDQTASFLYAQDGAYGVSLRVTDTAGSVAIDETTVTVRNVAPAVSPMSDVQTLAGSSVLLQTTFTDPGRRDTHTAVINWGDGQVTPAAVASALGQGSVSAEHVYANAGEYTARLEVTDEAGDAGTALTRVTVSPGEATGSLSGYVYLDVNHNGIMDAPEMPLPNIPVRLEGSLTRSVVTAADGSYRFGQLPAGRYDITAAQAHAFLDGIDTMGVPAPDQILNDRFVGIQLPAGVAARDYNFGERGLRPELVSKALLLASTPPREQLTAQHVNGSGWWSWQSDAEGMLHVSLPLNVSAPVIEVYTGAMVPLAIEQGQGELSVPVAAGQDYVLYVAGTANPHSFPVSWRIDPLPSPDDPGAGNSPLLTNVENPRDVNADGFITPLDALLVINALNRGGSFTAAPEAGPYLDVDANAVLSPRDALLVINELNRPAADAEQGEGEPPAGESDPLNPVLEWSWTTSSVLPDSLNVMMTPAVIDLNRDSVPDVVFGSMATSGGSDVQAGVLRALNGRDGSELFTVTDDAWWINATTNIAVGDIDGDGQPEILAADVTAARLIAFEHDGAPKWRSEYIEPVNIGAIALADLDADGRPEILVGRQALDNTGNLLWTGHGGRASPVNGPLSLVADVDIDGRPDVIAGNTLYNASGDILWQVAVPDGSNAIGNFDADLFPEIVLVSRGNVWLLEHTGAVKWGPVAVPGGGAGGPPTVAD